MNKKLLIAANTCLALILSALGFQSCNREALDIEKKSENPQVKLKVDTLARGIPNMKGGEVRLMYGVNPDRYRKNAPELHPESKEKAQDE